MLTLHAVRSSRLRRWLVFQVHRVYETSCSSITRPPATAVTQYLYRSNQAHNIPDLGRKFRRQTRGAVARVDSRITRLPAGARRVAIYIFHACLFAAKFQRATKSNMNQLGSRNVRKSKKRKRRWQELIRILKMVRDKTKKESFFIN